MAELEGFQVTNPEYTPEVNSCTMQRGVAWFSSGGLLLARPESAPGGIIFSGSLAFLIPIRISPMPQDKTAAWPGDWRLTIEIVAEFFRARYYTDETVREDGTMQWNQTVAQRPTGWPR